ncbi:MAG: hypothetical protein Q8P41_26980 [Pseudomonadota bacterium]|nr:hypothetical protein [Pseudomonadota bacterium]
MNITVALTFNERDAVSLLNWLARCNARLLRERPTLPLLYSTSVVYGREEVETWSDFIQLLAQGWEDCDALAAARAGELMARGWKALSPRDPGYAEAKTAGLTSIPAEVALTTAIRKGEHGLYHCIVRYVVNGKAWFDDPSARLGMLDERLDGRQCHERIVSRVRLAGLRRDPEAHRHPHRSRRPRRRESA